MLKNNEYKTKVLFFLIIADDSFALAVPRLASALLNGALRAFRMQY
jgi:hypothetical protein